MHFPVFTAPPCGAPENTFNYLKSSLDGFVKTLNLHHTVIPAQAGIHYINELWIPAYARMTNKMTFYEAIIS